MTEARELAFKLYGEIIASEDPKTVIEQALLTSEQNGFRKGLERAARIAKHQELGYFSQLEGQGEPEYSKLCFAMEGMITLRSKIRAAAHEMSLEGK